MEGKGCVMTVMEEVGKEKKCKKIVYVEKDINS